jgi:hypothetical protein
MVGAGERAWPLPKDAEFSADNIALYIYKHFLLFLMQAYCKNE